MNDKKLKIKELLNKYELSKQAKELNKQSISEVGEELRLKYFEYYKDIISDKQIEASWRWTLGFFLPFIQPRNEVIDEVLKVVEPRMEELKIKIEPLQKEYDLAYRRWFDYGHRDEKLKALLEEYETGTKGLVKYSYTERLNELEGIILALKTNESTSKEIKK
jgi:hypothetical protein